MQRLLRSCRSAAVVVVQSNKVIRSSSRFARVTASFAFRPIPLHTILTSNTVQATRLPPFLDLLAPRAVTARSISSLHPAHISTIKMSRQELSDTNVVCMAEEDSHDEIDIEELHMEAVQCGSTTYTDPNTGFTVFTELSHLHRGSCCGNQCRHCPYGWVNVPDHLLARQGITAANRKQAKVRSGDREAIKALLSSYASMAETNTQQVTIRTDRHERDDNNADKSLKSTKKTGGRHGGRLTDKNVPYTRSGDKGTSQLLTGERRSKADVAFDAMGTVDELCSIIGMVHAEFERDAMLLFQNRKQSNVETNSEITASNDDIEQNPQRVQEWLLEIMSRLFDIGSHVAKPPKQRELHYDSDDYSTSSENSSANIVDDDSTKTPTNNTQTKKPKARFIANGIGGGFDAHHVTELEDWIDVVTNALPELRHFILPTGHPAAAQLHVARCVCRRAERTVVPLVQGGVCDPTALQYLNRLSDLLFSLARWTNNRANQDEILYQRPSKEALQRVRHLRQAPCSTATE